MTAALNDHNELPDSTLEMVAARFKLLSEPMRLKLLRSLLGGERTVTELVSVTGAGQANVSKHLASLADAGIVGRRKEGLKVYYSIADKSIFTLCDLVCGSIREQLSVKAEALEAATAGATVPPRPSPGPAAPRRPKPKRTPKSREESKPDAGPEPPAFSISFD